MELRKQRGYLQGEATGRDPHQRTCEHGGDRGEQTDGKDQQATQRKGLQQHMHGGHRALPEVAPFGLGEQEGRIGAGGKPKGDGEAGEHQSYGKARCAEDPERRRGLPGPPAAEHDREG